ncbi:MAG: DUF2849 domain-containing protein, partial [Micropepsaceae bacterium]
MPQVLTANRLLDGEVVYLAADGVWVEELQGAGVLATKAEGEAALALPQAEIDRIQAYFAAPAFET